MSLAERIQLRLNDLKLSQAELARAAGVKAPSVHNWLSGKTKSLKGENLLRLANVLRCRPAWLSKGVGPMAPDESAQYIAMDSGADRVGRHWTQRPPSSEDAEILRLVESLDSAAKAEVLQWLRGFSAGRKRGNGAS